MSTAPPRATRLREGRWIGGVCTGLAAHLGWPLPLVRLIFLALTLANGIGIVAYLAFWAVMPLDRNSAGSRDADFGRMIAFGAVVVGLAVLLFGGWGTFRSAIAPILVVGLGAAILWQQWGPSATTDLAQDKFRWLRPVAGVILISAGVATLLIGEIGWFQGLRALAVVLLVLGGAAILALPWILRAYRDLSAERRALIREQERTEIAAQVHDSVLQTLTLIQQHVADPEQVSRLARTEERRLRAWLYSPTPDSTQSVGAAVEQAARQAEADHGAVVDVVQVGDTALTPELEALVMAGTEAITNASRHAGPNAQVSVYCEVSDTAAELFVRDRGPGFEVAAVPTDRHGLRHSIIGRMERVGGSADVRSTDAGTEVRLSVQREPANATKEPG